MIENQKKKNLIKVSRNCVVCSVLVALYLIITAICISTDFSIVKSVEQQNIVNTIAQIQIAIAALIATVFSITTTFFNDTIYGAKLKDVFKLRKGITLNLLTTIILLLLCTAFSIVAILMNRLVLSIFQLAVCIGIGIWISIQDLPLCFKSDHAIIKLLKNNYSSTPEGLQNTEIYNDMVIELINSKKIDKVYGLLKTGNVNQLIDNMFNLITSKLLEFKTYKDVSDAKVAFDGYASNALENISLLMNKDSVVFKDYGNSENSAVYLARIFYYIHAHEELLDENTRNKFRRVFSSLFWILFTKEESIQKEIVFKTYQNLLSWSFRECNLWVAKLLKKEFSQWSYTFAKYEFTNILFSEISLVLFNYYQYEKILTDDKRKDIKDFINNQEEYSFTYKSLSWNQLFSKYISNFNVSFNDLYSLVDVESFEIMLTNQCKSCLLSNISLADWWVKCLLNANNLYHYDFSFLSNIDNGAKETLSNYLDSIFEDNTKKVKLNDSFKKFTDFFALDDKQFEHMDLYSKSTDSLYNFKNEVKKRKELDNAYKNNAENKVEELGAYLKEQTTKYLDDAGFKDNCMNLDKIEARGFYNLEEMFDFESAKSLYLDMIKNCFKEDFRKQIEKDFVNSYITFNDSLSDDDLQKIIDVKPTFATDKVMYVLSNRQNISEELKSKLLEMDESLPLLSKNALLIQNCYGNENAIKFNYELHTFELKTLTEEEILKIIDKYKGDSGTYFYQGVQYGFDELKDLLSKKLFTMKIYIKYKIVYNKDNLCVIDPWGYYERRKKRLSQNV